MTGQPVGSPVTGQPAGVEGRAAGESHLGHPAVDAAVAALDSLGGRAPAETVEVYLGMHRRLADLLDESKELDTADLPASGHRP